METKFFRAFWKVLKFYNAAVETFQKLPSPRPPNTHLIQQGNLLRLRWPSVSI